MNYEKIITEIKSVREFTNKKVDIDLVSMIISNVDLLDKMVDTNLEFSIIEDGNKFASDFDGKIGYFGKMIKAPSYVLVFGEDNYETKVNAGYCLEWIRFSLLNSGISSCWLSTVDNVDYSGMFSKKDGTTLLGCIGIGEEYKGFLKKNTSKISERKGIAEFVYKDNWKNEITWEELEQLGVAEAFYLTKLAPSWGNEQPWAFVISGNEYKLFINVEEDRNYAIDAGIIALYFMKACESKGIKVIGKVVDPATFEKLEGYECQIIFTI